MKLNIKLSSILCFICVSSLMGQGFFEKGYKLYSNETSTNIELEKAIILFDSAIINNQNSAKAYMYRSSCKNLLGRYSEALIDIRKSIGLDSTDFKAYYFYGRIYFDQGFYGNSLRYYNKGLSINKLDAILYDERALCYTFMENYDLAFSDYEMVIKLDPENDRCYVNRGQIYLMTNKYLKAIQDFDKAISLTKNPKAYANKGIALAKMEQHEDALKCFSIAIEKMPKAGDVLYERAMSYAKLKKTDQACMDLNNSLKLGYKKAQVEIDKNMLKRIDNAIPNN